MIKNILHKKTGVIIKVWQKKTTAFITVVVLIQLYKACQQSLQASRKGKV